MALRCLLQQLGGPPLGENGWLCLYLWGNEGGKRGFLSSVGKRVSAGHPCLEASRPGVSVLLYLRVPNPRWQEGKLPGATTSVPTVSLRQGRCWERLRKQARAPGSCDLLSEAKGEPWREAEGGTTTRQPEAPAGLTECWGKTGLTPGKQVGTLTLWRRVGH